VQLIVAAAVTLGATLCAFAAPAAISDSIKQSATIGQAEQQAIDAGVTEAVNVLGDASDPTAQSAARVWLIQGASDQRGNLGSPDYLQHYAQAVNAQLLAAVSKPDANFRAKVQAGLAAQEIAHRSGNTATEPLTIKLLQDPLPSVALVGMKAASGLMPVVLTKPKLAADDKKLLDQILATIAKYPDAPLGGPIVTEAYDALQNAVFQAPNINPDALVPLVLKLQQARIAIYKTGVPASPQADSDGVVILFSRQIWQILALGDQKQAIQNTIDLVNLASNYAQQAKARGDQSSASELIGELHTIGTDLRSIFSDPAKGVVPDANLYASMQKLAALGQGSGGTVIEDAGAQAVAGLKVFADSLH
jgi:hypothetical protein